MGMLDDIIRKEIKQGREQNNERLDSLLVESKRTNELLAQLVALLGAQS